MKTVSLFLIALSVSLLAKGQDLNKEIVLNDTQKFLVGEITIEALSQNNYKEWYKNNYEAYAVDQTLVEKFKEPLKNYQILVFLGTWCGDSKREVPRFIKILDAANFPDENLKIVALDRRKEFYKKSPTGEEWGLNIKRVPTFIFYKNGKEVNRIIETPNNTLENDILDILTTESYVPNKAISMHFD